MYYPFWFYITTSYCMEKKATFFPIVHNLFFIIIILFSAIYFYFIYFFFFLLLSFIFYSFKNKNTAIYYWDRGPVKYIIFPLSHQATISNGNPPNLRPHVISFPRVNWRWRKGPPANRGRNQSAVFWVKRKGVDLHQIYTARLQMNNIVPEKLYNTNFVFIKTWFSKNVFSNTVFIPSYPPTLGSDQITGHKLFKVI